MDHSQIAKPEAVTIAIEDIVNDVRTGRIRIPRFQRGFRWDARDVERLLESIRLGYPIGGLLLWKRPAPEAAIEFGRLKLDAPARADALWVVDGQQRITSLANVLLGSFETGEIDKRFNWAFEISQGKFVQRTSGSETALPLSTLFQLDLLLQWSRTREFSKTDLDPVFGLARAIREYKVPAYIVTGDDEPKLRDIFDRMNNYGRRLGRAEVFHALHGGNGEVMSSLRDIANFVDEELGFGRVDEATIMSAVLARRGANVFREVRHEFNEDSSAASREFAGESEGLAFQRTADALKDAIQFLRDDACVPHFGFLAYRYLLVVLVRVFAHFPKPQQRNRDLLRRWYWRATLLGPEPMKGWTQTLHRFTNRVLPGYEDQSVQSLLKLIEEVRGKRQLETFDLEEQFRYTSARSRVVLCALWSCRPRSTSDLREVYGMPDSEQTIKGQSTARRATVVLVPKRSPVSLFIALEGDDRESFETALNSPQLGIEWLHSHCLDEVAMQHWRDAESERFLDRRSQLLSNLIAEFLRRQSEFQFEDTPPLQSLLWDEPEDEYSVDDIHG